MTAKPAEGTGWGWPKDGAAPAAAPLPPSE